MNEEKEEGFGFVFKNRLRKAGDKDLANAVLEAINTCPSKETLENFKNKSSVLVPAEKIIISLHLERCQSCSDFCEE